MSWWDECFQQIGQDQELKRQCDLADATKKKTKFITIDAETDPFRRHFDPVPFLWCIYDGRKYVEMVESANAIGADSITDELIAYLLSIKTPTIAYAHNGGKFDWYLLLKKITLDDLGSQKIKMINGRIAEITIGNVRLRDSYLIFPVPLKVIQKDSININLMTRENRHQNMTEIKKYCRGDCRYLYDALEKFFDRYGMRNLTLPQAAFKDLQSRCNFKAPILKGEAGVEYYEKYAEFFYGGRVSLFDVGVFKKKFYYYDINSAYPWAMKFIEHPWSYQNAICYTPRDNEYRRTMFNVIAVSHGALPQRQKDGRLLFPCDDEKREFFATGHEIIAALNLGLIKIDRIKRAYVFKHCRTFENYIDHYFEMKKASRKGSFDYLISKLFMNATFGKFAQNPQAFEETFIVPHNGWPADVYEACAGPDRLAVMATYNRGFEFPHFDVLDREVDIDKQRFYNVVTSASITGAVRAKLLYALHAVRNPLYTDTDSIICTGAGSLEIGPELGQWSLDGTGDKLALVAKKVYALTDRGKTIAIATKGHRADAHRIEQAALGDPYRWEAENPTFSLSNIGKVEGQLGRYMHRTIKRADHFDQLKTKRG